MATIRYHTTTEVWLHLEDYYNRNVTPEQAKEVIERLRDYDNTHLRCENMGINGNWIFSTCAKDPLLINDLVQTIQRNLDRLLV